MRNALITRLTKITALPRRPAKFAPHEASLLLIEDTFGWVSTSEEFVRALQVMTKSQTSEREATQAVSVNVLQLLD